jgi:tRNA pseudouridine55 synthase
VLVVDKPRGLTSRQVASAVGRAAGDVKSGHTGTLDPLATGVLVVCLGRATLLTRFLGGGVKEYIAEALLGVETDTYDTEGTVVKTQGASDITVQDVKVAVGDFQGRIQQFPPPYSAVKHKGRPMYQYARAGRDIERQPRTVHVESMEVISASNLGNEVSVKFKIVCGPGTYVRSLVHDIGRRLGCGACVSQLRRLKSGIFSIETAATFDALVSDRKNITRSIISIEEATREMPSVQVGETGAIAVGQGKPLQLEWISTATSEKQGIPRKTFRVFDGSGRLLALYGPPRADDGEEIAARPVRVLRPTTIEAV